MPSSERSRSASCFNSNRGLGQFAADIDRLNSAVVYLEERQCPIDQV